jgi:hypothetical protein
VRKSIIGTAVALALIVPASAHAGIAQELRAASKVEQKTISRYRGYNVTAVCDQQSRSKFWCSFFGDKGDCFLSGKAYVRNPRWRVQIVSASKNCF